MLKIQEIVDDAKCYEQVSALRWPEEVTCPHCALRKIKKRGFHSRQAARQRYRCRTCQTDFDDLSQTPLAGHHQPLKMWLLCLYFMGLNLSNRQIAQELELNQADVQQMTNALRAFVYNAEGTHIQSTVGGVTTVYIAGFYEFIENGATDKVTKYDEGNAVRCSGYGVDDGVFTVRCSLGLPQASVRVLSSRQTGLAPHSEFSCGSGVGRVFVVHQRLPAL